MSFEDLPQANYPGHYDNEVIISPPSPAYLPYPGDVESIVDYIVKMRNSIIAIETELGINPSGNQTTVAHRLDLLENVQGQISGLGQSVHRIQIADKYSVNSVYSNELCVGQVGLNIYDEGGIINNVGTIEVFFKAQVYVEKNTVLTLRLYNVTSDAGTLITEFIFNNTGTYQGGHFTRDTQLNLVSQVPIGDAVIELRAIQTTIGGSLEIERKSIIWDASLIVKSSSGDDGYAMTGRYVPPTSDDLIVWTFDDTVTDTFINSGANGTDGDLVLSGITPHSFGYNGMFDSAAALSGDDMYTQNVCASPSILSVSMWINPTAPIVPDTLIAATKLDVDGNPVFTMKFDSNNAISFEYLGTDGNTYSFTTPAFLFNSTASWLFVGFVHDGTNVYTSVNGNYELVGVSTPMIKYTGPLDAGAGKWGMINSNLLVDDVRIAQVARDESWFRTTYKLAINQYP